MATIRPTIGAALSLALPLLAAPTFAQVKPILPAGFVLEPIGSDWSIPVGLAFVDDHRLLVAEKAGKLWFVTPPFEKQLVLDLTAETLFNGDRGFLGVAADPAFAANGFIYCLLVVDPNADGNDGDKESFGRLVRYTTSFDAQGKLVVDPSSRLVLIGETWASGLPSLHFSHSVGQLRFLGDGSLVLTCGDGAHYDATDTGGLDPAGFGPGKFPASEDIGSYRSASLDSLAGKILRIDPATGLGLPDNPFYTGNPDDHRSRVWALGLRNPFRFTLQPGTGPKERIFVADVGWNTWEEVNVSNGGEDFGWPCFEGASAQPSYAPNVGGHCGSAGVAHTPPLLTWNHTSPGTLGFTGNCASGVAFYTGTQYPPAYQGALFFCDYGRNWLRAMRVGATGQLETVLPFGTSMGSPIGLVTHPANGDIVYISLPNGITSGTGRVLRLRYLGNSLPPVAVVTATPAFGPAPLDVTLDASGSSSPGGDALTFAWKLGDGATATGAVASHVFSTTGAFHPEVTVTDSQGRFSTASILVTPGNTPPKAKVLTPADGIFYAVGDTLALTGAASDREDDFAGVPLQQKWVVDLVHNEHVHPEWDVFEGPTAALLTEPHGPGAYYRITFEVQDTLGLVASQTVNVFDGAAVPVPHLVSLSDFTPRLGQTIHGVGHVEFPGNPPFQGPASLLWDWGDGTTEVFDDVKHQVDVTPSHAYAAAGTYVVRLVGQLAGHVEETSAPVTVSLPKRALAVFVPLVAEGWVPWNQTSAILQNVLPPLAAKGVEVQTFFFDQQKELASWMEAYLDDGVRDVLVVLDFSPSTVYAGEDDGSLAERWLEHGNAIVWTGDTPFSDWLRPDGTFTSEGAGLNGADDVLDAASPFLEFGTGLQTAKPIAALEMPSLITYMALRAMRYDQLGPEWSVYRIYAEDADKDADPIAIRHVSGGIFAQFFCSNIASLPRAAVLAELLNVLLAPSGKLGIPAFGH